MGLRCRSTWLEFVDHVLYLFALSFMLPPSDGIGVVVDASVFHESFLASGIGKLYTLVSVNKFG